MKDFHCPVCGSMLSCCNPYGDPPKVTYVCGKCDFAFTIEFNLDKIKAETFLDEIH